MGILSMITTIIGLILLVLGLIIFAFEIAGIIKYSYLLNRMHAAGMGDTLGIMTCLLGLIFISGWNFTTLKIFLVIVFLWFASPTASHLVSRLEATTNEELNQHVEVKVKKEEI